MTTLRPIKAPLRVAARISLPGRLPWALLAAASLAMFTAAASGTTRAPFLIGGPLALAVASSGVATAETFPGVVAWATLGGCSGMFTGVIFTEVRPAGTSLKPWSRPGRRST